MEEKKKFPISRIDEEERADLSLRSAGPACGWTRQNRNEPQSEGVWRTYDATDGLPGGVECLLQDRQGLLWLGTSVEMGMGTGTGLCRFDGAEFITYTTDDGLADNRVMRIYEDHKGRLWLGTQGGVSCFDGFDTPSATQPKGRQFTNYTMEDGLADNHICAIYEDRQGRLWFGTRDGGVSCAVYPERSRRDGQRFTNYTTENGLPYNGVNAICEDQKGRLWFAHKPGGASWFDGRHSVTYNAAAGLAGDCVYTVYEDHRGRLWFGTDGGVSMFDGQRFTNYTTESGLGNNHVWTIYEDRQGRLWFGFEWAGDGVSLLVDSEQSQSGEPYFITYTTEDGLLDNEVYDIIQDQEGLLWFAHSRSGLTCFDPETVRPLTRTPVSQILIQDTKGNLWFGNSNELCFLPKQRREGEAPKSCDLGCIAPEQQRSQTPGLSNRPVPTGFLSERRVETFNAIIYDIVQDSKGGFWMGTQGDGIYHTEFGITARREDETPAEHFTTQDGLSNDAVLSLLETKAQASRRNGTIWAGTWADAWIFGNLACLCRFDGEAFEAIETPHPVICQLFEDSRGQIWMGRWRAVLRSLS